MGAVALGEGGGGMRESVSVLAVGGAEGVGAATGQLWKSQSPHVNKALNMFAPSWLLVFTIQSAILYKPDSGKSAPSVKCVWGGRHGAKIGFLTLY